MGKADGLSGLRFINDVATCVLGSKKIKEKLNEASESNFWLTRNHSSDFETVFNVLSVEFTPFW